MQYIAPKIQAILIVFNIFKLMKKDTTVKISSKTEKVRNRSPRADGQIAFDAVTVRIAPHFNGAKIKARATEPNTSTQIIIQMVESPLSHE